MNRPIPTLVTPKYDIGDVVQFTGQPTNDNYVVYSTSQIQYAGDMPRVSYGLISENFFRSSKDAASDFEILDQSIIHFIKGANETTLALVSKYVNDCTEVENYPPFIEHKG